MTKALVQLLGDARSLLRSMRQSSDATIGYERDLSKLAVTATKTAQVQVRASVNKDARLRQEIKTYKSIAAAATRGSREQIAAANLASKAELHLSRSLGVTAHEARRLASSANVAERDLARTARGALVGSGAFRSLGRSIFYASSYVLGGYGLVAGLKAALSASREEQVQMGQLSTATVDAGLSWKANRAQIEANLASQRRLGFVQADSVQALAKEVRATRTVGDARKALSLADDISRGSHVALAVAANAVARAYGGQTGALRRLVPFISKNADATTALAQANAAYSGSAIKYARSQQGTQDRLNVALHQTAVIVGDEVSPQITRLEGKLTKWLSSWKNQARVQHDVASAAHTVGTAVKVAAHAIEIATPIVRTFSHIVGGTKNTIELLATALVAGKLIGGMGALTAATGEAGAAGAAGLLLTRLGALARLAPIVVEIFILEKLVPKSFNLGEKVSGKVGSRGWLSRALGIPTPGEGGQPTDAQRKAAATAKRIASFSSKYPPGTTFTLTGLGDVVVLDSKGNPIATFKAGDKSANAAIARLAARTGGTIASLTRAEKKAGKASRTTSVRPPATTKADQALAANQLALAAAKTDAAKLTALVDERRLLAARMDAIRASLKTASGTARNLLMDELTKLTKQDTAAYTQIQRITHHQQSVAKAAARAAAHTYLSGLQTTAETLLARADAARTVSRIRATYGALVAFYKTEAHDAKLTAATRARYAKDAIDEQKKMAAAIVREQRDAAKAIETKQLASLGVGPGQSISTLLQRLKDAADAKENGTPTQLGTPTVKALKTEAAAVSSALKGTYLDTNLSRNVLSKIKTLLSGKLGAINAEMRGKIQQLLTGLKADMTSFDGFNLTAADKRRRFLDRRFADRYGTNLPRLHGAGSRVGLRVDAVTRQTVNYYFSPHLQVIANEPIGRALDRAFFRMRVSLARPG